MIKEKKKVLGKKNKNALGMKKIAAVIITKRTKK